MIPFKSGRSIDAATWASENDAKLTVAAERFGISREAVRQGWVSLFPGRSVPSKERNARIREVVRGGGSASALVAATGACDQTVRRLAKEEGVALQPARPSSERWVAAIEAVRAGASYADAAADFAVSEGRLSVRCREAGVHSARTGRGRRDGRVARAIARVKAGETQAQAARAERCARAALSIMLVRASDRA